MSVTNKLLKSWVGKREDLNEQNREIISNVYDFIKEKRTKNVHYSDDDS